MRSSYLYTTLLFSILAFYSPVQALDVPDYPAGIPFGGSGSDIYVELYFDLLCSVCKFEWPLVRDLLTEDFMNATVEEKVTFNFVVFPLPYHHNTYYVSKMIPYFIDTCI